MGSQNLNSTVATGASLVYTLGGFRFIGQAGDSISEACIGKGWGKLWFDAVPDFLGFEEKHELFLVSGFKIYSTKTLQTRLMLLTKNLEQRTHRQMKEKMKKQ